MSTLPAFLGAVPRCPHPHRLSSGLRKTSGGVAEPKPGPQRQRLKVLNRRAHQGSSLVTQFSLMGWAELCSASDAQEDRLRLVQALCSVHHQHNGPAGNTIMSNDPTPQPNFRRVWHVQPHIPEHFPPHGAGFQQEAGGTQGGQPQENW